MNIITKFTVASDSGMNALLMLTGKLALEKFSSFPDQAVIQGYIAANFNPRALLNEVNSMSNQWLVVYADDAPVGYARITSKGEKPVTLADTRAIRIADFGVLKSYPQQEIRNLLLDKCLAVCRAYEGVWINEYSSSPFLEFFESHGFTRLQGTYQLDELPADSVCLVLEK